MSRTYTYAQQFRLFEEEEFKNLNTTAENIAMVIYNLLRNDIDSEMDLKVILFETERNYVEYPA